MTWTDRPCLWLCVYFHSVKRQDKREKEEDKEEEEEEEKTSTNKSKQTNYKKKMVKY